MSVFPGSVNSKISVISRTKNNIYEGANSVGRLSHVEDSFLGFASYISSRCSIIKCKIGRYCSIASGVQILFGDHPTKTIVSTHPAFYSKGGINGLSLLGRQAFQEFTYCDEDERYFVEIGNDVWIGSNVLIMSGVRIGNGAIVAAGSVVTKDVKPYSIVAGTPARHIRFRFDEKEVSFLESLKWWERDIRWLSENAELFLDVKKLMGECSDYE